MEPRSAAICLLWNNAITSLLLFEVSYLVNVSLMLTMKTDISNVADVQNILVRLINELITNNNFESCAFVL